MLPSFQTSRGRCVFNNSSHDNGVSLNCCRLLYSNLELLGRTPLKFRPSEKFSYTFILNNFKPLRKQIFLELKVNSKHPVIWSRDGIQVFTIDLVLDLLIGRHLILFLPKNLYPEIS